MTASASTLAALRLPETLPVFPLSNALLLPGGRLPLNIFETRYLAMIDDALGSDRMIGMIQPFDPETTEFNPPLQRTGCAGRITAFMEDGSHYLITLTGICRFDVASELPVERGYRRVVPDWTPWAGDFEADEGRIDRPRLLAGFKGLFGRHAIEADWEAIEAAPDARLVPLLAMIGPFGPAEKQSLLLARNLSERTKLMTGLVEMALTDTPAELRH